MTELGLNEVLSLDRSPRRRVGLKGNSRTDHTLLHGLHGRFLFRRLLAGVGIRHIAPNKQGCRPRWLWTRVSTRQLGEGAAEQSFAIVRLFSCHQRAVGKRLTGSVVPMPAAGRCLLKTESSRWVRSRTPRPSTHVAACDPHSRSHGLLPHHGPFRIKVAFCRLQPEQPTWRAILTEHGRIANDGLRVRNRGSLLTGGVDQRQSKTLRGTDAHLIRHRALFNRLRTDGPCPCP